MNTRKILAGFLLIVFCPIAVVFTLTEQLFNLIRSILDWVELLMLYVIAWFQETSLRILLAKGGQK